MFLALPNRHALLRFRKNSFSLIAVLCFALVAQAGTTVSPVLAQTPEGLRFELPANNNLRIENSRGGVFVEVWAENFVSVTAITDSGQHSRSPAVIQRTDGLLSIRVTRGPQRINLQLRIPARAHAAINTGDGSVEVKGLPAALLVQTISGEIRLDVPRDSSADVIADSKTGTVSSAFNSALVTQSSRPQLKGRLGAGGAGVRLYSQAGNITLGSFDQQARNTSTVQSTPSDRREQLSPTELPAPRQRPELTGQNKTPTPAGTPAPVSNGPEEISEGDVIRVDTELVSVNVSVVDRSTSRGVNDLTKDDFRLYEDNAQQQIAHFDSASAPFNLILVIDLSGSTARVVELIKGAALHFVEAARPFDRIGIITFAGGQVVVSSLTNDHQALRQRINSIQKPDGSTKLYDSLAFAMDEVSREAKDSRRNAIVVMSDGLDSVLPNVTGEGSTLSYEEVSRRVKEFDGVLYSIWVKTQSYVPLSIHDIQQETFDQGHDDMKDLADDGGGAFYECLKLEDLAGAYERVVADLGMVYTLSYRPTNKVRDGSWRAIRVNVSRPTAVARGKRGYYAK
ncbi:MAG: Ca-activated chloride channel [Blastocatellia bacterium]|nr:Ca-activated chloride channel [Blastocatellia bacterium]